MDDRTPLERPGHVLQGPHRQFPEAQAGDLVPLRLVVEPGGLCIEVSHPDTLLGRHSAADIRIAAADVSRCHCRLVFADGHWMVRDLNSLNGVFVNDERMHEATLYDGDRLRVGSVTFAVHLGLPAAAAQVLRRIADVLPLPEAGRQAS